jgi:polyferredoxin
VQVCPTGIDIRDGLQLECIHCAQCVDACNSVMRKLGRPEGLIRYGSQNGFAGAARHMFRPRVVIYPLIVTLCLTVFGVLLANRGDAMIVQKRMQAAPYAMTEDGLVRSTVFVRIDNRTEEPRSYRFEAIDGATIEPPDPAPTAAPSGSVEAAFFVLSRPEDFERGRRTVTVRIHDDVSFEDEHEFDIMGPFGDL